MRKKVFTDEGRAAVADALRAIEKIEAPEVATDAIAAGLIVLLAAATEIATATGADPAGKVLTFHALLVAAGAYAQANRSAFIEDKLGLALAALADPHHYQHDLRDKIETLTSAPL